MKKLLDIANKLSTLENDLKLEAQAQRDMADPNAFLLAAAQDKLREVTNLVMKALMVGRPS